MDKKKILIVDDEENFAELTKLNLEKTEKYEVATESKGANAMEAVRKFRPDLVLLDILMPDMDGGDIAFQLKNDKATKDIPIVFVSALATESESLDKSGRTVLAKPIMNLHRLMDIIDQKMA